METVGLCSCISALTLSELVFINQFHPKLSAHLLQMDRQHNPITHTYNGEEASLKLYVGRLGLTAVVLIPQL